jgi:hypothetical protein
MVLDDDRPPNPPAYAQPYVSCKERILRGDQVRRTIEGSLQGEAGCPGNISHAIGSGRPHAQARAVFDAHRARAVDDQVDVPAQPTCILQVPLHWLAVGVVQSRRADAKHQEIHFV